MHPGAAENLVERHLATNAGDEVPGGRDDHVGDGASPHRTLRDSVQEFAIEGRARSRQELVDYEAGLYGAPGRSTRRTAHRLIHHAGVGRRTRHEPADGLKQEVLTERRDEGVSTARHSQPAFQPKPDTAVAA